MRTYRKIIYIGIALLAPMSGMAQTQKASRFAIKAHANIGMGDAMNAKSSLEGLSTNTNADEYGVDFGWRFWQKGRNSLEVNIGLGLNPVSTKLDIAKMNYSYAAPSVADMDGESYVRYTELSDLSQKVNVSRLSLPIYLSYAFNCTKWLSVHADLGVKLGFKTSSKLSDVGGGSYCYGIYPQYNNLLIDADYMNDFGRRELSEASYEAPEVSALTTSLLAGAGLEFNIYGPLSADISVHYDAGFSNLYKTQTDAGKAFTAESAPLTYTVNDGSRIKSLTNYISESKLSYLSLGISLIYRF